MNRSSSTISKFGWSPRRPATPPIAVLFHPFADLKFPHQKENQNKCVIFLQEDIILQPNTSKIITLQMGVQLSFGVVLISLTQELKMQKCSLSNESIVEDTDNIVVTLHSNADKPLTIKAGDVLCNLTFVNST